MMDLGWFQRRRRLQTEILCVVAQVLRQQFDGTKCSDSIAVILTPGEPSSTANGLLVLQRAAKVWGTALVDPL
jgi:hypothetical protein